MSQVFGADQLGLMSVASLWVNAGFLDDVEAHENALLGAGFERGQLPVNADTTGFNPRGDAWGKHLLSDRTHHKWVVVRVANPATDPNARSTSIGGAAPRYAVEIHSVPKDFVASQVSTTPIWEGNDITDFLSGTRSGGQPGWPDVQRALMKGPRGK